MIHTPLDFAGLVALAALATSAVIAGILTALLAHAWRQYQEADR